MKRSLYVDEIMSSSDDEYALKGLNVKKKIKRGNEKSTVMRKEKKERTRIFKNVKDEISGTKKRLKEDQDNVGTCRKKSMRSTDKHDRSNDIRTGRDELYDIKKTDKQENFTDITTQINNFREKKGKISTHCTSVECIEWTDAEYISETNNIDILVAENLTKLFQEENTIPFIARYRKCMTGRMEADQLRTAKESFDRARAIKRRANAIIEAIDKLGKWTTEIHSIIKSIKSLDELEHIYSFFKPASKRSLAERAKAVGLGPVSTTLLQGESLPSLSSLVDPKKEGLKNVQEIRYGIIHIIADIISKNKTVYDGMKVLQKTSLVEIQTSRSKSTENKKKTVEETKKSKKSIDESKYKNYFNFKVFERDIKPHQIMAINRGEAQNVLRVKIILLDSLELGFKRLCLQEYRRASAASEFHKSLLDDSIDYAYKKLIKPLITRRIKSDMKERAVSASIQVFISNVKQLLLAPPVRGKVILGVDPGFYHGCKLAVVSEQGRVLETDVIYPHKKGASSREESEKTLINMVKKHKVNLLAIGNATACRETEVFVAELMERGAFDSDNVSYTIVDESGASIYSCSPEAKSEFPSYDPNIISAISIARRLQDPLAELVKIEPKHLGVGMYQHDLPEKQLTLSLDEVVSEAVSFVGVDVNTASSCLLRRVAGLNRSQATNILKYRDVHGPFTNREQLRDVKGIGNKTYEQCIGFIRIVPESITNSSLKKELERINLLDQTWIHPESYKVANEFLRYCKCDIEELGTASFIRRIESYGEMGNVALAKKFGTNETTMEIITKGLTMKKDEDIRLKANEPIFRNALRSIDDLRDGTVLRGVVRNVTDFGAFVDTGVGKDGLVHVKWFRNGKLGIGQRVQVQVLSVDRERQRIAFKLMKTL